MADVFFSHSSKNKDTALELVELLENHGIECWIAPRDVIGGMDYASQLVNAIKNSKIFFLIASEAINKSDQVLNEVEIAVNNNKIILPFKIDDAIYNDSYKYYLNRKHWIDANPAPSDHYVELVKTVKYLLLRNEDNVDTANDQYLISLTEKNRKKLINKTSEKRLSFGLSIESDEKYTDQYHFYEHIYRYDIIDKVQGKYYSYRWIKLKNVSDKTTTFLYHKECGENKVNFKDLRFKARLSREGVAPVNLIIESLTEVQPNFVQVVKIYFDKPLKPDESIEIFYRLDWPGEVLSYYEGELSTSISLTRYLKGVGQLKFGIMENYPLYGFELLEIGKDFTEKVSNLPAATLVCEDIAELKPLHNRNYAGAYFTIADAKDYASYRIIYKERQMQDMTEEDDFI